MVNCCVCGKDIDENSNEAFFDVPFGEEILHFCCKKCYEEAKV